MDVQSRSILITGATDGIGLALAQHYHARGARLVLVGRRPLAALDNPLFATHTYCQVDLTQEDCAKRTSSWLHENYITKLDLVIHNAALGYVGSLAEHPPDNICQLLAVNLLAPIRLTHALLPLVTQAHGKFVYISSVASALPSPNYAVYSASKAALDGFVRNLQIELMATRSWATAQVIHPGATRTALHAKSGATRAQINWDKFPAVEQVAGQIAAQIERPQRTSAVGVANRITRFLGRSFPVLVDAGFIFSTRKSLFQQPNLSPKVTSKRHCLITGAADGIGKALALTFAADGYTITGIDLDETRAEETLAELRQHDTDAAFVIGNLGDSVEVARLAVALAERPPVDLCIHNAGINAVGPFVSAPIEAQIKVIQVNLIAPILLTAALLRGGRLHAHDSLVFIASLSHFVGYPGAAVYAASKDGLASFARSLRIVNQANGGNVLTVYPGPTRTAHARRYSPDNRNEQRRMAPEQLAQQILQAVQRGQRTLIPGWGNWLFAFVGHWFPGLAEGVMRRVLFDKLTERK